MLRTRAVVVGLLLAATTALGVADGRREPSETMRRPRFEPGRPPSSATTGAAPGLVFRLGEGAEEGEAPALVSRPEAERLPDAETRRVLDRLPPLAAPPREEPFALREGSLPPPRPGRTTLAPFP